MKKILFVCEHLPNEGGIGPALINQMNILDKTEYDIYLCPICNYIDAQIVLPSHIHLINGSKMMEYHIINYNKRKSEYSIFERLLILLVKQLRRWMGFRKFQNLVLKRFRINNEFDIAVAYSNDICKDGIPISGGSNYCVKYCVNAKKKIAWIHNEVQHQGFTPEYCKENFKLYDCIINVSEGCKRLFDAMAPEYIDKSHVIYNIIDYSRIERLARESKPVEIDNNMFTIVTAARLEEGQKRISRIISCCRKLKEEGYDGFRWLVLGDGPNSIEYSQSIKEYGLEDVLCFLGRKNNPYVYMKNADVFILPSLYESFGLVLKEAMAVGCPVISSDFEAAKEIIHDNYDGFICDNSEEGIFNITKHILDDKSVLEKIRTNLRESDNNLNAIAVNQFQTIVG